MAPHRFVDFEAFVIGYGNELRRDDGIGPYVAREIASRRIPSVRTMTVHQLTPELAEELSAARFAVFVDAGADLSGEAVSIKRVEPSATAAAMTHASQPDCLLQLALIIFGSAPETWSLMVAAEDFSAGEGLSPGGRTNADAAVKQIEALLGRFWGH